jgi:hypothetical protein
MSPQTEQGEQSPKLRGQNRKSHKHVFADWTIAHRAMDGGWPMDMT